MKKSPLYFHIINFLKGKYFHFINFNYFDFINKKIQKLFNYHYFH